MMRDLNPRWWRFAAALALLIALAVLFVPLAQHGHAFLLFAALAPVLWLFSIVIAQEQRALTDGPLFPPSAFLELPSLSHLPPPDTLA